ncbi:MAG: nucleotidyltransferase family protein [Firmicutes bacterium]|nr:nucleotidyltransferase family protein [Bacillota bacterium]
MKILGLVVEYNPLHLGHLHHLRAAQSLVQPTATIAVMSGSFTQRGEPAIVDKWARAEMALAAGVDLVIELPTAWATQSAPNFAAGAVRLLALAGATDICFGSEQGHLAPLQEVANILLTEPLAFRETLHAALQQGHSYAAAQTIALQATNPDLDADLYSLPNNTLGVQYLLAIKKYALPLRAHTIPRIGAYHSLDYSGPLLSASAIRHRLLATGQATAMPPAATEILLERLRQGRGPVTWQQLAPYLFYRLRTLPKAAMNDWPEASAGLGDRLWTAARSTNDWDEFISRCQTRRFPLTRLQRVLTYILLGLGSEALERINIHAPPPYLRVLAINTRQAAIRQLLKQSQVPLIYGAARLPAQTNGRLQASLQLDTQATDIYTLAWKQGSRAGLDYTHPIVTS